MVKTVRLAFSKIKYSGNSVGDDIRVEVEIIGKFFRLDQQIKPGMTAIVNREIGKFETDQKLFRANVFLTVVEKDLLFNDTANVVGSIRVNTNVEKTQDFTFFVRVKEKRSSSGKFWGRRVAIFEITLQASLLDMIAYLPDEDESQGFLKVRIEDGNPKEEFLPAYLKVKRESISTEREYFTILEGVERGRRASLSFKGSGSSWLVSDVNHEPAVRAKYSISQKVFILNGKKYKITDNPATSWKKGAYDIEIPDYPHGGGHRYIDQAKRAMTWFRIGHGGSRYLHTGLHSAGCITITEIARWMEIYNTLIKARKGDFMSVGSLEVID
ncbi:hypothetical protein L6252_02615 [Candidatus Parcubacteria bacterium]|nr:hypothetical protein [Candidatus Parcubacteria bacterium]